MAVKESVTERLRKMEVVEGVVPTAPAQSRRLSETADLIRRNNIAAATRSATADLEATQPDFALEPATRLLSGSRILREQVAGFAQAGINLFLAKPELLEMPLAERAENGANGAVSRVLVSQQRILLETPRVVVRFKEGTKESERAAVLQQNGVVEIGSAGLPPDTTRGAVTRGDAVSRSLDLMKESSVVYADPDFIEHTGQRFTPNDPEFTSQWHHKNIEAEKAWDHTKGEGVRIAVVDNGFDTDHPDLAFGPLSGWFRETDDRTDADFV